MNNLQGSHGTALTPSLGMCSTEHMPTNRYRVDLLPSKLNYRNGTILLQTLCQNGMWIWCATKDESGVESVILLQRPTMLAFAHDRFEGFDVEAGSPADKILQRLVREGAAEALKPGEVYVRRSRRQLRQP